MRILREIWSDWHHHHILRLEPLQDSVTSRLKRVIPPDGSRPDLLARHEAGEVLVREYTPEPAPIAKPKKPRSKPKKPRSPKRLFKLPKGLEYLRKKAAS
jgi:hypothetical protein